MSHAGQSIKKALAVVAMLDAEKPHTSITDWIEVLTSDRYEELSLDGIPELVESVNIQGHGGTGVSSSLFLSNEQFTRNRTNPRRRRHLGH
jgi:hypothetical protein